MANEFEYIPYGDKKIKVKAGLSREEKLQAVQKADPDYKQYKELYLDIPDSGTIPTFPEYKQQLSQAKADEARRADRGIGEKLIGAGETALSTGSAVTSAIASPLVYGGETIKDLFTGQPVESFEDVFGDIVSAGTYQPRTEVGQEYAKNVGDFLTESKVEGAIGLPFLGRLGNAGTGTAIKEGVKQVGKQVGKVLPKGEGGGVTS